MNIALSSQDPEKGLSVICRPHSEAQEASPGPLSRTAPHAPASPSKPRGARTMTHHPWVWAP